MLVTRSKGNPLSVAVFVRDSPGTETTSSAFWAAAEGG
jgi:hypothetical protein